MAVRPGGSRRGTTKAGSSRDEVCVTFTGYYNGTQIPETNWILEIISVK
jgi:hypothetical protein